MYFILQLLGIYLLYLFHHDHLLSNVYRLRPKNHVKELSSFFFFFLLQIVVFCYLGDIIIERWIPYGPESERRTIVQTAPPPAQYSVATHTVIVYDAAPSNIIRKFEKLGIAQENPDAYIARYGASLLDPATLMQHARNAGVTEDIVNFL
jgi:hypothetical protein